MAGLNDISAQYATLAMGSVNVLMTLVSLVLVERAGRKTLLLVGFVGMFIDTLLLGICIGYAVSVIYVQYRIWQLRLFLK